MAPMMPMDAASLRLKPEEQGQHQRPEDPELARRPDEHHARVLQQRPEVGERADTDENEEGIQLVVHAKFPEQGKQAAFRHEGREGQVRQDTARPDGQEQHRLVVLLDGEIQQHPADPDHQQGARGDIQEALGEAGNGGGVHVTPPPIAPEGRHGRPSGRVAP